jgi:hypothetical protein
VKQWEPQRVPVHEQTHDMHDQKNLYILALATSVALTTTTDILEVHPPALSRSYHLKTQQTST